MMIKFVKITIPDFAAIPGISASVLLEMASSSASAQKLS